MKGFSLIELLIALSLFLLLSSLALFSGGFLYAKTEYQTLKNDIKTAVRFAANQSFISGQSLYLSSFSGGEDWSSGMKLFLCHHQKKQLIHQWTWQHPNWSVRWTGFHSKKDIPFSLKTHSSSANGKFTLLNLKTNEKKTIILNRLGHISEEKG